MVATVWICVAAQGWALGLVDFSGVTSVSAGVIFGGLIVYERAMRAERRSSGSTGRS
ncbi:MAG: hypothetical protein PW947_02575 [Paraburkholderia sp.]|nr:hypothetical protein [Paraburkholderia sp.]